MAKAIEQNQSTLDRFIRILAGGACLIIPSYVPVAGWLMLTLLVIGLYLIFSGLSGQCLIYKMLGFKTCK
ncbi:MAG: DUF2892 domain-containing protein [Candidatus Saganbacteria bacterium]|nr:DUF2892 domain-containing protein [Candidatus Saganbacteria bacterium]